MGTEKSSRDGGNNVKVLCIHIVHLNCPLKDGYNGKFHVYFTTIRKESVTAFVEPDRDGSPCVLSINNSTLLPKQNISTAITATPLPSASLLQASEKPHPEA